MAVVWGKARLSQKAVISKRKEKKNSTIWEARRWVAKILKLGCDHRMSESRGCFVKISFSLNHQAIDWVSGSI